MTDDVEDGESKKNERIRCLIDTGAELAGGAVGGAIGFLAGGPVGAAVLGAGGAAVAKALKHIGNETCERLLGPREKVRVGGVLAIAADQIEQRLKNGETLRDDDFFEENQSGRSDAEEVAESIMLKSQREPEEKKIPYMGRLLANVAFHKEISSEMAHQLAKTAEQLTYRQLCILRLAVAKDDTALRASDYRGQASFSKELYQVLYECLDLYYRGLINFGDAVAFGPTDVKPGNMTVQGLGVDVYSLMQLYTIPSADLNPIAAVLR